MEVKIVDPETGAELPVGEMGELCFRGYAQFEAYYKEEALTPRTSTRRGGFIPAIAPCSMLTETSSTAADSRTC